MRRRGISTERVIAVMGALVLALGALIVWRLSDGGMTASGETDRQRVLRQARAQLGPRAEVRLIEAGRGRALCGYVGVRGEDAARAFLSRPNRLLLGDDPLRGEFHDQVARDCPRFPAPPRPAAMSAS